MVLSELLRVEFLILQCSCRPRSRRPIDDYEKGGKHAKYHREEHFYGGLLGLLLNQLTLGHPRLFGLGTQNGPYRDAKRFCLDQRHEE